MTAAEPSIDAAVIDVLTRAAAPMREQTLATLAGRTPAQVRSALAGLDGAGCTFDSTPSLGLRLRRTGIGAWADYLQWRDAQRNTRPRRIEVYRSTASTQDVARRMVAAFGPDADGALAVADEQTAGRGRLGRRWHAPSGACLTFTRVIVSGADQALPTIDRIMLSSAVAVAQSVEALIAPRRDRVGIKWPNDIVVDGRKLAGILIETLPALRSAIIGIGVNVTLAESDVPDELKPRATSLAMLGCKVDRLVVLSHLVRALDAALHSNTDAAWLIRQWRQFNIFSSDQPVTFRHNGDTFRASVIDLDATEGLIVRTESGTITRLPAASTSVVV